jgi:hypothetical protein
MAHINQDLLRSQQFVTEKQMCTNNKQHFGTGIKKTRETVTQKSYDIIRDYI